MGEVSQWSDDASTGYQLTTPAPDGAPEGMAASLVNDQARETMAAVRRQWEQHGWFDYGDAPTFVNETTFTVPNDHASQYVVGRQCRASLAGPFVYGDITSVTGTTTLTVEATWSSPLTASLDAVALGVPQESVPPPVQTDYSFANTIFRGGASVDQVTPGAGSGNFVQVVIDTAAIGPGLLTANQYVVPEDGIYEVSGGFGWQDVTTVANSVNVIAQLFLDNVAVTITRGLMTDYVIGAGPFAYHTHTRLPPTQLTAGQTVDMRGTSFGISLIQSWPAGFTYLTARRIA